MPAHVQVELDIYSGMPNPTWVLTDAEAEGLVTQLAALPPTSATALEGNLGYRGFIVQVTQGGNTRLVRIQKGAAHIAEGATTVYARDQGRELERWLLHTGKPHIKSELYGMVEREIR